MSQIHILDFSDDKKTVDVIFHISIPLANNASGVNYQTAVVGFLGGSDAITSRVADAAELIDLKAGVKVEIPMTVRFSSLENMTDAKRLIEVKAAYTARATALLAEWQNKLLYYGWNGAAA